MSSQKGDLRAKVQLLQADFPCFSSSFIQTTLVAQGLEVARARLQLAVLKKQEDVNKLLSSQQPSTGGDKFESPFALAANPKERSHAAQSSSQPIQVPELPARTFNPLESDLNTSVESYLSEKSEKFYSSQSSVEPLRHTPSSLSSSPSLLAIDQHKSSRNLHISTERGNGDFSEKSPFALSAHSKLSYAPTLRQDRQQTITSMLRRRKDEPNAGSTREKANKKKRKPTDDFLDSLDSIGSDDHLTDSSTMKEIEEMYGTSKGPHSKRKQQLQIEQKDAKPKPSRLSQILPRKNTRESLNTNSKEIRQASPPKKRTTRREDFLVDDSPPQTHQMPLYHRKSKSRRSSEFIDLDPIVVDDDNDANTTLGNDSHLFDSITSSPTMSEYREASYATNHSSLPFMLCSQVSPSGARPQAQRRRILEESD